MGDRQHLKLSPEEHRVLQECNRESFYYRSLPLATAAVIAVNLAVKRGLLSSHPKWGPLLKSTGAGFVGWFIGKLSYQNKCAEKLMQLPNSHLGEALKRSRLGHVQQPSVDQYSFQPDEDTTGSEFIPLSQEHGARDLFPQKDAQPTGLEDRFRPSVDNPQLITEQSEEAPAPQQAYTSYDELRKKNRESVPPPSGSNYPVYRSPSPTPPPPPHREMEPSKSASGTKNLYGDVWDN